MSSEDPEYLYKITPDAPPEPFPAQAPLSALDAKDGFVHLSTAAQVPKTADLFFTEIVELWVIKLRRSTLNGSVAFDGGCAHFYGNFGASNLHSTERFQRGQGQTWAESMSDSSWLA